MSKKVMRLIYASTGLMECRVCGERHCAQLSRGGHYLRGSWQCINGCKLEDAAFKIERPIVRKLAPQSIGELRPA